MLDYHDMHTRSRNVNVVRQIGFSSYFFHDIIYTISDFIKIKILLSGDSREYIDFIANRDIYKNSASLPGKATKKNLIFLQLESMDSVLLHSKDKNNKPLLPF